MIQFKRKAAHAATWMAALCFVLLNVRCSEEDAPQSAAPQLTVNAASNITRTTADVSGTISNGALNEVECAFIYSISKSDLMNPESSSAGRVEVTPVAGVVSATLTSLQPKTNYFYCLYARSGKTHVTSEVNQFVTDELGVPELAEVEVLGVDEYTLTLRCCVTSDGGADLQRFGFEYKKAADASWLKSIYTDSFDAGTTHQFTLTIPDLEPGVAYKVRAIAVNKEGFGYSNEAGIDVTTAELTAPVVNTQEVTAENIGADYVTVVGVIENKGGSDEITRRGFAYSTTKENPLAGVDDTALSEVEEDQFHTTITGLKPNTTYHLRAFASNVVDGEPKDGYGNTITFTTKAYVAPTLANLTISDVTAASAKATFDLTPGTGRVLRSGICYSSAHTEPTMADMVVEAVAEGNALAATFSDLEGGRTYYVAAFAVVIGVDGAEATVYSEVQSFQTQGHVLPSFAAFMAGNVTASSAKLSAVVTDGTVAITEKGFCYSTNASAPPTVADWKQPVEGSNFEAVISDLTAETTYYSRAYLICQVDDVTETIYTDEVQSFTTLAYAKATVSLPQVSDVDFTSVKVAAQITDLGDGTLKEKGFCWKEYDSTGSPQLGDGISRQLAVTTEALEALIEELQPGKSYYLRAYVKTEINGKEYTVYSDNQYFTTKAQQLPEIFSVEVVSYSDTSFEVKAYCSNKGIPEATEYGFCWTTDKEAAPADVTERKATTLGNDNSYSVSVTGLVASTTYYVYAYIVNAAGTAYSAEPVVVKTEVGGPGIDDNPSPDIF